MQFGTCAFYHDSVVETFVAMTVFYGKFTCVYHIPFGFGGVFRTVCGRSPVQTYRIAVEYCREAVDRQRLYGVTPVVLICNEL